MRAAGRHRPALDRRRAFGTRIHERGYLAFVSEGEQHYSDDERTLMALFAFAVGIALDRVGVATA